MNTTTTPPQGNDNNDRPKPARIGAVIRQTRTRAATTQEGLAEKSGVDVRTVQHIEAGRSATRLPTLGWLAKALGTTPAALLPSCPRWSMRWSACRTKRLSVPCVIFLVVTCVIGYLLGRYGP